MKTLDHYLTDRLALKLKSMADWYTTLDNRSLRMDCPNDFHDDLIRKADEMDRLAIISWQEWRDLRLKADAAYLRAITGADYPPHHNHSE